MSAAIRPWRLADLTLAEVRDFQVEVAVLPLGATEPHNLHLPYGTDTLEANALADMCCRRANAMGAKVLQLPAMPYGTETNMRKLPLAMNLNPSTLGCVIKDLIHTLELSGVKKFILFNSHGGNDFKPLLRELYGTTGVQVFLCNWYQMILDVAPSIFEEREDHAGEVETSLIMWFAPHLVRYAKEKELRADDGQTSPLKFEALREGWVSMTRPWHLLTKNSGSGNPHAASAEKGEQIAEVIASRIAKFLLELSEAEIDSYFPFSADSSVSTGEA